MTMEGAKLLQVLVGFAAKSGSGSVAVPWRDLASRAGLDKNAIRRARQELINERVVQYDATVAPPVYRLRLYVGTWDEAEKGVTPEARAIWAAKHKEWGVFDVLNEEHAEHSDADDLAKEMRRQDAMDAEDAA